MVRACLFQDQVLAALPAAEHEGIYPNFLPSADTALPMVATRDIGKFAADCLLEPPPKSEIIDLLGPSSSSRQCAEKLGAVLGKNLRIIDIPPVAQVEVFMKAGLPKEFAESLAEMNTFLATHSAAPQGDRTAQATTTLDQVLRTALSPAT